MTPGRPDTDILQPASRKRGRLKVFLGMSPGVGKTYEMLRAARRRQAETGDVLVGVVETHGRKETESLLRGLDVLARNPIDYKGRALMEFDIDAAIARRPGVLLVDEYAHSNVPGSRHPKRWQDVEEILKAGIDVWTTLNVQHLESLSDVVLRITGARQRETVPDSALSRADDIEVVDITPDELRKRLEEGKVYVPEMARLASENFFKVENLTALRELALRRAAQTVDDQLLVHLREKGVSGPWAAGARILVLIGGDPMAASLVRGGRRLSDMMMDAPWTVATVDRADGSGEAGARLGEALRLAEQLGARTVTLTGDDLVRTIMDHVHRNHVTQIVLGKGRSSRWRGLFGRSLAAELLRSAHGVAIHIVTDETEPAPDAPPARRALNWTGYALGAGFVGLATLIGLGLDTAFERVDLGVIYLAAVVAAGALHGVRPALAAATLAFVTYNFLFLHPRYSLAIGSPTDVLTLVVFWAVALMTGALAGRVREQARRTRRRAAAVSALLGASQALAGAADRQATARILSEQTADAAGARAVVLLPRKGEAGDDIVLAAGAPDIPELGAAAMAAARWAWEHGEAAGHGTGTLPQAGWTFRPLNGVRGRAGVAGVAAGALSPGSDEERLTLALLDQGAVAIERADLAGQAVESETYRRADRFRTVLMNSVSHDLRTPLSTVLGSATTLIDYGESLTPAVRADLLDSIREEAERLNRYVGDLLDMTRLEGGALQVRTEWTDIRDILNAAGERVSRRLGRRALTRDFPAELSLVQIDEGLLEQALVNILENAIAYSPDGSTIEMAAYEDRGSVVISIEDEGRGIPTADLERVFDKFRRMDDSSDRTPGVGLGLAIAKGFVEAMDGRIAAASPINEGPDGAGAEKPGTRILIRLPKAIATHRELL